MIRGIERKKYKKQKRKKREKQRERLRTRQSHTDFDPSFIDDNGDAWTMRIHGGNMARLEADCGFNVCNIVADANNRDSLVSLFNDISRMIDVFFIICEEQCIERRIGDYEFGKLMWGDTLNGAMNSFLAAIISFSPDPKTRELLRRMFRVAIQASNKIMSEETKAANQLMDAVETQF